MISVKKFKILTLFLALIFCWQLSGQESMTLPKSISIALENNLQIKIADKSIEIADKNNTWAAAGKVPTIALNGNFSNNLINDNNPASFLQGTYYTGSLGASLDGSMVVYSGGRFRVAKDQLDLMVQQERLNKDISIHSLLRDVYQQYYNILFQQERLYVLQESYDLSKSKLDYEKVKREYGQSNSLDIIQFENALLTDSINIISQKIQVKTAKYNFHTLLRLPLDMDYVYEDVLAVTEEQLDSDKLKETLSESNYTLKSLYVLSDLNRLNTQLAKAQRRPTIAINGGIGISENAFKFFADDPNTGQPFDLLLSNRLNANLGATTSWDIYDGGLRATAIENAQLEEEIASLSIEEAEADLINQLDVLSQNYNSQLQLLSLSDAQIKLTEENLRMLDERLKNGLVNSLDYRTVQLQYLNAAFEKVNAIYELILTKSEIDFLVGKFNN